MRVQVSINAEGESTAEILAMLDKVVKEIKNGSKGDFEPNLSWWLDTDFPDASPQLVPVK